MRHGARRAPDLNGSELVGGEVVLAVGGDDELAEREVPQNHDQRGERFREQPHQAWWRVMEGMRGRGQA